jgi:hypothetical protein
VTGIALAKFVRITKLREDRRPRRETFFAEAVSGHCGSSRRFVGFACFAIVFLGCVASARAGSGLDGITVGVAPAWVTSADDHPSRSGSSFTAAAGRRYLLVDRQVHVGAANVERYTHLSWQIVNESDLQDSSRIEMNFDPTFETVVIHSVVVRRGDEHFDRLDRSALRVAQREPNLEEELYDGRKSAMLFIRDLRVGDIVDWACTVRGLDPTLDGKYVDTLQVGLSAPVLHMRTRVLLPANRHFDLSLHGPDSTAAELRPERHESAAGVELTWERRDVPAYRVEDGAPREYSALPFVQISEFTSWHDVAAWGTRLFRAASAPASPIVRDWALAARREHGTASDFIQEATRFVQDAVRYVGIEIGIARRRPSDPAEVLERRYGDCKDKAALLVSILRAGDVEARPALVSTTRGRDLGNFVPSPELFNHVIVRVTTSSGDALWLDPTIALQGGPIDRFRHSLFGSALTLDDATSTLETLESPDAVENSLSSYDTFVLPDPSLSQADARLTATWTYSGLMADVKRVRLKSMPNDDLARHYRSHYENEYPTIHVTGPVEQTDDRDLDVLRVVVHFTIPSFWTRDESRHNWHAPVNAHAIEIALGASPAADRKAPMALPVPFRVQHRTDIRAPFGLMANAEEIRASSTALDFHFVSTPKPEGVIWQYDAIHALPILTPADFEGHRAALAKARPSINREVWFTPSPLDGFDFWKTTNLTFLLVAFARLAVWLYRHMATSGVTPPGAPHG